MKQYLHYIEEFVAQLKQHLPVQEVLYAELYASISTEKLQVKIYYPGSARVQDLSTNIPQIHIDIDLIIHQAQKVLYRLRGLHGVGSRIYARKTIVARLDKRVTIDFLKEYHLQSPLPGKYRYGLYDQGELVSVAVFSGGRIMKDIAEDYRSFELVRFCHKADTLVVGGISKLIKAFAADFYPQDIMTYADKDWCTDSSLECIGFEKIGEIGPIKHAIIAGNRITTKLDLAAVDYFVENLGSIKLKLVF